MFHCSLAADLQVYLVCEDVAKAGVVVMMRISAGSKLLPYLMKKILTASWHS